MTKEIFLRLSSHNNCCEARIGCTNILPLDLLWRIKVFELSLNCICMHYKPLNRSFFCLHTTLNEELSYFIALRFLTIDFLMDLILNSFWFQSSKHDFEAQKDVGSNLLIRLMLTFLWQYCSKLLGLHSHVLSRMEPWAVLQISLWTRSSLLLADSSHMSLV